MKISDYPDLISDDEFSFLIAADWLEEQNRNYEAECLRQGYVFSVWFYFSVIGLHYTLGHGDGYGQGDSYGIGRDNGLQYTLETPFSFFWSSVPMNDLVQGQAYMWMITSGWMFIGRFVRREGLFGVVISEVTNICRTGGTAWPDLCRGVGRDSATFKSYDNVIEKGTPFPIAFPFMKWSGDIPKG
jgi:hypothetical protein